MAEQTSPIITLAQARTTANKPKASAQDLANALGKPVNDKGTIRYPRGYSASQRDVVYDYLQTQVDAEKGRLADLSRQRDVLQGQMKKQIGFYGGIGGYTGTKAQVSQLQSLNDQIDAIGGKTAISYGNGAMGAFGPQYTGTLGTLLRQQDEANAAISKAEKIDLSTLGQAQKSELALLTTQLQEDFLSNVADINPLNAARTAAKGELDALISEQSLINSIPKNKRTQEQKDRLSALSGEIGKKQTTVNDLTGQIEFITGQTEYKNLIQQSTDLQKQIDPIVEQINALPKKGSPGYTPEVKAKLAELNNQLKPLQDQSKGLVKSISGLRNGLLENQNKTISLVVTGEKNANKAEYNTEKARLAAGGYQDLRLSKSRPLTPEELEKLPYSEEMGFTAEDWQSMIDDGYTPPSAPSGQIYSDVTSITKDSPYYEAAQKVNADVKQALDFAEKYGLTQRYKSGDTTIGFSLNSLSKLSDAINDDTLSGWERQMAGKVASTMYRKVGGFFDRKDLTAEEIGFKLKPVLGSDKMFSATTKAEETGGHTAYFIKNDDGTYSFAGANWSYTKPDDGGFFGGIGGIILGVGAAILAPGIGGAITGLATSGAGMTATQIAINTAINAAVGSAVTNTLKTAITGGEFDFGKILSGAATSGLTAGAASYLGNTISSQLGQQEWFKSLPPELRTDIARGASSFAINLAATGDLSQSFIEGLSAGAQGQLNRWVASAKDSVFGKKSDLVEAWSPVKLREEGFGTGSFNGLSVPKNLSDTAKSALERAASEAAIAAINGQDPKQAFINNLVAEGFEVANDRIQDSNLLKPDSIKRQLGIDPDSPMDAKTTAAVDNGIKAAQDAIRNGQDPISAFGGALVRSGLKYVGGEIKQMTGLDFAAKANASTATPGVSYFETGVPNVIGKTTSFGDVTSGGRTTYFPSSEILTDPDTGIKYVYDQGEFVRLDDPGVVRQREGLAKYGLADLMIPEEYGSAMRRARELAEQGGEFGPSVTQSWDPDLLTVDIAAEAGIDPRALFSTDGRPTDMYGVVKGVAADALANGADWIYGMSSMAGLVDQNSGLARIANSAKAYSDETRPWEISADAQRFYDGLKNVSGVAETAEYVARFAADNPRFAAFNIASEILQELPTLGAGLGVRGMAGLVSMAPAIAARFGVTTGVVMEIAESAGATYNSEYSKAMSELAPRVARGELTEAQAQSMANDRAFRGGAAAGGVTGSLAALPGGTALIKAVVKPATEVATSSNAIKQTLAQELVARGYATGRVGALNATNEALEESGISALVQAINSNAPINWSDVANNATWGAIIGGGTGATIAGGVEAYGGARNLLTNTDVRGVDVDSAAQSLRSAVNSGTSVQNATQRFAQQLVETYNYLPSTANQIATEFAREEIGKTVTQAIGDTPIAPEVRNSLVTTAMSGSARPDTFRLSLSSILRNAGIDQQNADAIAARIVAPTSGPVTGTPPPTDITPPPVDVTPPPTDITPPPVDVTPPPTDITPPPVDVTPPPVDITPPPVDVTPPPTDITPPPVDVTPPPTDITPPPVDVTPSPTDITPSPVDVTPSPTDITPSPVDVTPTPTNITPSPINVTPPPTNITPPPIITPPPPAGETIIGGGGVDTTTGTATPPPPTAPTPTPTPTPAPTPAPAPSAGMAAAALSALPIIPDPEFTTRPITTSGGGKFVSALAPFLQEVESNQAAAQAAQQPGGLPQTRTQGAPVSNYFNYGQSGSIEDALGMGGGESFDLGFAEPPAMFAPMQFRSGGIVPAYAQGGTRHGHNAHGALNIVHAAGKPRIDYRRGDAVTGMGDGQSDDIPAMLADGEFVIPADVVSALGNGSTKAGSDKLYEMMHAIRDRARSTGVKDLPPPAKSPLSYLSKKGRR